MRLLTFILFSTCLYACGQKHQSYTPIPAAKKLADSAYNIIRKNPIDSGFQAAVSLLKQATLIDSNYASAFEHLFSYQSILNDYPGQLVTTRRMSQLWPKNPQYLSAVGMTYEFNNDTISSKEYFKKSIEIYKKLISSLSDRKSISEAKGGLAMNLLFLGEYEKGQSLLNELIQNSTDSNEREGLKLYSNKTGSEIIKMMKN